MTREAKFTSEEQLKETVRQALADRLDELGEKIVTHVAKSYIRSNGTLQQKLIVAVETKDSELIKEIAHQIRGGHNLWGGEDVVSMAEVLSNHAKIDDWEKSTTLAKELTQCLEKIADTLKHELHLTA